MHPRRISVSRKGRDQSVQHVPKCQTQGVFLGCCLLYLNHSEIYTTSSPQMLLYQGKVKQIM